MLSSAAEMIRLGLPGSVMSFFTRSSWCLHSEGYQYTRKTHASRNPVPSCVVLQLTGSACCCRKAIREKQVCCQHPRAEWSYGRVPGSGMWATHVLPPLESPCSETQVVVLIQYRLC